MKIIKHSVIRTQSKKAGNLYDIAFCSSDTPKIGDWVVAIDESVLLLMLEPLPSDRKIVAITDTSMMEEMEEKMPLPPYQWLVDYAKNGEISRYVYLVMEEDSYSPPSVQTWRPKINGKNEVVVADESQIDMYFEKGSENFALETKVSGISQYREWLERSVQNLIKQADAKTINHCASLSLALDKLNEFCPK